MRHTVRLAVQEQYLRGATMIEKWDQARRLGFDAIELRGAGDGRFGARLDELKAAAWKCGTSWATSTPSNARTRWFK